jgi:hypothetical protein
MVFNNIVDGTGLIQEIERICNLGATGITSNSQKLIDFTARINNGLDRFYSIAFKYDALWNFDDRNQTDLPIATTNIVSGMGDYLFDDELLQVTEVFAKDSSGTFHALDVQDDEDDPAAYLNAVSGIPSRYELVGNSIIISDTPNYNSTSGLKVTFKRNAPKFIPSNGSVPVGIPSLFHPYLARYAAFPYLVEKSLKHAGAVKQLILEDEAAIAQFISNRAKPKRIGLRVRQQDNR